MTLALRALCGTTLEPRTRTTRWGLELSLWSGRSLSVQTCAPDLDAATRNAAVILGRDDVLSILDAERAARVTAPTMPAPAGGPLQRAPHHPALDHIAYRTKAAGLGAEAAREYLDAALADPRGRAVRVWVECGPDLTTMTEGDPR